ncbi:MAG: hypothetical protein KDA41_16260 [Planctomycetales bacterium]|nr:hypothetical protein [Planctomycetales bacterium]
MSARETAPAGGGATRWAAWLALALVLALWAPLFLCQPLWQDVTQYDVTAQELLRGSVLYRDVTDTNFPGVVLIHAAVRYVAGFRSEALRAFDLVVVGAIACLLVRLATIGKPKLSPLRVFGVAVVLAYYFSCAPICHCQRDPWMLLPASIAVSLTAVRIGAPLRGGRGLALAIAEGLLWGAAVWIKPHVVVPAVSCWVAATAYAWRMPKQGIATTALQTCVMVAGGAIIGAAGLGWLYAADGWNDFWDIMLHWSGEYRAIATWSRRLGTTLTWFIFHAPWSLLHFVAVPVACAKIARVLRAPTETDRPASDPAALLLCALYLGWLVQALLLQLTHEYVVAATLLLAVPVLLTWDKIAVPAPAMRIGFAVFVAWALAVHPLLKPQTLRLWPTCATHGSSPAVKDLFATGQARHANGTAHWQDLQRVADFLRQRHVGDFEVTCWDDSSQQIFTLLRASPGTRYMHMGHWMNFFPSRRQQLIDEVRASPTRYVVSDCQAAGYSAEIARVDANRDTPALPDEIDPRQRGAFPWNQPVIFRAGRYLVHEIKPSIDKAQP